MKSTAKSNIFKSRAVTVVICAILILCALLSFGLVQYPILPSADEDNTVQTVDGIRFVQVAAGEDFAIGLTFDGDLYGWSLNKDQAGGDTGTALTSTLGTYYSSTPTKIDVKFRQGPGGSGSIEWTDTSANGYHKVIDNDKIKKIVATRTTAAFLTEEGYIYTWGKDAYTSDNSVSVSENVFSSDIMVMNNNTYHYLLYRPTTESESIGAPWYTPYIVNYNYYPRSDDSALHFAIPSNTVTVTDIAAGEYNYVILYSDTSYTYTYVWGSLLYSVVNAQHSTSYDYTYLSGGYSTSAYMYSTAQRRVVGVNMSGNSVDSLVAGGYNIGLNRSSTIAGGTSLQLRGRNFLTSQGITESSGALSIVKMVNVVGAALNNIAYTAQDGEYVLETTNGSPSKLGYLVEGALIGNNGKSLTGIPDTENVNMETYYGVVAGNQNFINNTAVSVYNSHDEVLQVTNFNDTVYYKAYNYGVSLGNDVGYGIAMNGDLNGYIYGWGDNKYGQLGANINSEYSQTPVNISGTLHDFVTVAAGKQLSAVNNKAFHSVSTLLKNDNVVTGFNDNVKNGEEFVSGAINKDGELYVWSNLHPTLTRVTYGDVAVGNVQDTEKFVAVYSGYGNNIFAITKLGKVVRIQATAEGYTQDRYDSFGGVTNWEIDDTNTVAFAPAVISGAIKPDLGQATFYVWNADSVIQEVEDEETETAATVKINGGDPEDYKSLVKSNAIGDVYRILGLDGDDSKTFLSRIEVDETDTFKPVFRYGTGNSITNDMSEEQQKNMFDVDFIRDSNGVGIQITPKQSSKGYTIAMDFYIARYNSETNFTTSRDTALYFDYKKCTITFTIADTPTVKTYTAFEIIDGVEGNSNIPLLDPNNNYNKYYSVAVQDVSSGFDAIATYFNNNAIATSINKDVETYLDLGFPASSKIAAGDLNYYLGSDVAADKYNNRYQFLFTDRDADRISIRTEGNMMEANHYGGSITGNIRTIAVKDIDTGITISDDLTLDDVRNAFIKDFNNIYGLYAFTFSLKESNVLIGFSYDVILFEAKSTSGDLQYNGDSPSVSDYKTTRNSDSQVSATILAEAYATQYNADYSNITSTRSAIATTDTVNIVQVFSQASLRLSKNAYGTALESVVNGEAGSEYTYTFSANPENSNVPFFVGDTATIDLSKFFASRSVNTVFSYKDEATATAYKNFNDLFYDQTGNGTAVVTLSGTTLRISPTTAEPLNIEVTIQRFANDDNTAVFANGNEKIKVTFIFSNIVDFTLSAAQSYPDTFLITKNETINIIADGTRFVAIAGNGVTAEKQAELMQKLVITTPQTASTNVFTVSKTAGTNASITIVPKTSGTGKVMFAAVLYGKTVQFEITINVRKTTLFSDSADTITLVDDQYIYVDEIKSKLEESNTFGDSYNNIDDYVILYNDSKAIYFTTTPDGTFESRCEIPSYIRQVVFEGLTGTKPNIRIVANNSSVASNTDYYMHVRFTNASNIDDYDNAPDGTIIEAIYILRSGKIRVPVSLNINCKNISSSSADGLNVTATGSNLDDYAVTIAVSELLDLAGVESPSTYSIVIIRADSATANYFNYASVENNKSIRITPILNTPDVTDPENNAYGPELEVSASNASGTEYWILTFNVSVDGILTVLPAMQEDDVIGYGNIWIYSFIIVFGVLAIIFVIRFIVYFRKRAKQRAIIKRNQELIRMRDRIHAKGTAATREEMVKTKLKMNDPKYAKLMNEMRKNRQEENGGVILENSDIAATTIDTKSKKKKKKGGKKTVAELKAELEAKKAAFAAAQAQSAQPVDPFQDVPMDGGAFDAQGGGFGADDAFGGAPDDFGGAQSIDGSEIIFDATDVGDGM